MTCLLLEPSLQNDYDVIHYAYHWSTQDSPACGVEIGCKFHIQSKQIVMDFVLGCASLLKVYKRFTTGHSMLPMATFNGTRI
jgi:hypothetical protein